MTSGNQISVDHNQEDSVARFVHDLRSLKGLPLNFIQANELIEILQPTLSDNILDSLNALTSQTTIYQSDVIAGRYILYPRDPVWETEIDGIHIVNVPRLDAASQYVATLRDRVPALSDLLEPPVKGDPRSSVYTEPVSLQPSVRILTHLVELLGHDARLVFTIERALSGRRILYFEQLP